MGRNRGRNSNAAMRKEEDNEGTAWLGCGASSAAWPASLSHSWGLRLLLAILLQRSKCCHIGVLALFPVLVVHCPHLHFPCGCAEGSA
jgi:hypothetical protein